MRDHQHVTATPIPATERIVTLDVLRGLALYGVLTANLVFFYSGLSYLPEDQVHVGPVTKFYLANFVESRAISTLTILFGVGFTVQLARAGDDYRVFVRRMLAMGLFGVAHILLLWWGDILWNYALVGLTLVWFRRRSPRALVVLGVALILVPVIVLSQPSIATALRSVLPEPPAAFDAEVLATLGGSDRIAIASAQLRYLFYFEAPLVPWFLPWILGHFLLGLAAGKIGLFARDGADHRRFFRWLLGCGIAITGGGLAAWFALRGLRPRDLTTLGRIGMVTLREVKTLATVAVYVSAVALLMQHHRARRLLVLVAPVGRMPLTTYLMQSLIATFIFYGWGLGWIGEVGATAGVAIAAAIYVVQVAIAHVWLGRFRPGPAEWVLRRIVYRAG